MKIDDEDQAMILLCLLPKSYDTLVITLLIGRTILTVDKVSTSLLETSNVIEQVVHACGFVFAT